MLFVELVNIGLELANLFLMLRVIPRWIFMMKTEIANAHKAPDMIRFAKKNLNVSAITNGQKFYNELIRRISK